MDHETQQMIATLSAAAQGKEAIEGLKIEAVDTTSISAEHKVGEPLAEVHAANVFTSATAARVAHLYAVVARHARHGNRPAVKQTLNEIGRLNRQAEEYFGVSWQDEAQDAMDRRAKLNTPWEQEPSPWAANDNNEPEKAAQQ